MICYLVRHGKDDETIRGGWSQHPLSPEGVQQVETLAEKIACNTGELAVKRIYSSDLKRAIQTAKIIADRISLPVISLPQFRETNNGDLAGMKNSLALERYPGLFWNQLGWEQCYPNGESPKQFYKRISTAWKEFSENILHQNENALLITHGGVIQVILSMIHAEQYTNTSHTRRIPQATLIGLRYENGRWQEIEERFLP